MSIPSIMFSAIKIRSLAIFYISLACTFSEAAVAEDSVKILQRFSLLREVNVKDPSTPANSGADMIRALGLRAGMDSIGPTNASYKIGAQELRRRHRPNAARRQGGIFNSVPIAFGALPAKKRWQSTYRQIERGGTVRCKSKCPAGAEALHLTIEAARDASLLDKLAIVNRAINDFVTYVPDRRNYGQLDHWASPEQTLRRKSGDCEDYAILKMAALASLGVPSTSMSLVVLLDRRRRVYHAVLAVSTSEGHFILDNLAPSVRHDTEFADYQPLFSFSTDRSWIHGQKKDTRLAAMPVELSTQISPGEGPAEDAIGETRVGKGLLARI